MDVRALVAREANEANFACLLRLQDGFHPSVFGKNAIRVRVANDFVELEQIDPVGLQAAQRLVDLTRGSGFCASVNLGHQKRFFAVTIAQRIAHADFTLAAVVVPAVVEKIDALIETGADDANAFLWIGLFAEMIAAEPNERDFLFAAAQGAIRNAVPGLRSRGLLPRVHQQYGGCRKPQESPPRNAAVHSVASSRILREIRMTCFILAALIFLVIHGKPAFDRLTPQENPFPVATTAVSRVQAISFDAVSERRKPASESLKEGIPPLPFEMI